MLIRALWGRICWTVSFLLVQAACFRLLVTSCVIGKITQINKHNACSIFCRLHTVTCLTPPCAPPLELYAASWKIIKLRRGFWFQKLSVLGCPPVSKVTNIWLPTESYKCLWTESYFACWYGVWQVMSWKTYLRRLLLKAAGWPETLIIAGSPSN